MVSPLADITVGGPREGEEDVAEIQGPSRLYPLCQYFAAIYVPTNPGMAVLDESRIFSRLTL